MAGTLLEATAQALPYASGKFNFHLKNLYRFRFIAALHSGKKPVARQAWELMPDKPREGLRKEGLYPLLLWSEGDYENALNAAGSFLAKNNNKRNLATAIAKCVINAGAGQEGKPGRKRLSR